MIPESIADKAHVQMTCTIECDPKIFQANSDSPSIYCFKKANYEAINDCLSTINFEEMFSNRDINDMVETFYSTVYDIFDEFIPKSTIRLSNKPIWFDKKLTNLRNIRNRQYEKLCKQRLKDSNAEDSVFIKARDEFDAYNKQKYEDYVKGIIENSNGEPKKFWQFINGKRKSNSLPCKLELDGRIATDDADKAKLFAEFFSSVYVQHEHDDGLRDFIDKRCEQNTFHITPSQEAIQNVLRRMDVNKGVGPDSISPIFLRSCADVLSKPLHIMFTKSIEECVYPDKWKIGRIIPIYKSGKKSDIRNYRGVNIMPNIAKVFEKVIYNQLKLIIMPKLQKNQHGFLSNRNIETNLMEFSMQVNNSFEERAQTDTFYADISKAFDHVKQPLLIRKIAKFPVSNTMLRWFISYFAGRKQYARVGNCDSESFDVPSSVGQGTILGPLFFLVFFDDSDTNLGSSTAYNFADDKKITRIIRNINDAHELQKSIDNFMKWCSENFLEVNLSKCKIITFSHKQNPIIFDYYLNGKKIDRVYEIRDLGVMINSKLDFKPHIEYIKKKSESMLAFVRRTCRANFSDKIAKLLYNSLVRSNLLFASVIWSPYQVVRRNTIESVQKQAVIFLNRDYINRQENNYVLAPYKERCAKFDLESLVRCRVNAAAIFIHKVIMGKYISLTLRNEMNINRGTRSLRNPEFIRIKGCKTDYMLNSPFNIACRIFNHAALFIDPTLPTYQFAEKVKKLPDSAFGDLCKLG